MSEPTPPSQPAGQANSANVTAGLSSVVGPSDPSGLSGASAMSGMSSAQGRHSQRERFAADELAIVLSHYDIGVIDTVQEFPRGSRRAPKLLIRTDKGIYLLKRRAKGKDDPFKVAFCHAIQLALAAQQFPLPSLIGTRRSNNSMLQWKGATYELFEYIKGASYDNSLAATSDAGRILGLFHKLLKDYEPEYEPPTGSYHAARVVATSFKAIPKALARVEPRAAEDDAGGPAAPLIEFLQTAYNDAAMRVNEMGLSDWPMQIVHSDWHPGNMLYRGSRVVAVIDYDAARIQQRVTDIANGALQFSILGGGDDPAAWPEYIDEARFKRFLRGYDQVPECVLSRAELRTIPWLMIEALIAESVIPIANTGQFARLDGMAFLQMVERKVKWLHKHADHLAGVLEG